MTKMIEYCGAQIQKSIKGVTTKFSVVVMMSIVIMTTAQAFATHQWQSESWSNPSIIVRGSSSLNNLNINGATDQATLAQSTIMSGAQLWNNVGTPFQLNQGTTGTNFITAGIIDGSVGNGGVTLAITSCSITVQTLEILDCDTKYDKAELWTTNTSSTTLIILRFVATHEFGHWVRFQDIGDDPGEDPRNPATTMAAAYNGNTDLYSAIQTHDSQALAVVYP